MAAEGLTEPLRTVIIGSGNVATAVAPALELAGAVTVVAVYSPTYAHAAELAGKLNNAVAVDKACDMPADADLYIVAVKDDAVAKVAAELPRNNAVWLHTSGGVPAETLSPLTDNYGVFYPLQTFSKGVDVNLAEVPVFVEGSNDMTLSVAERLGRAISPKVHHADGDTRCKMHAAAVFACNFTNHLWAIADDILRREAGVDLSVLHPLLKETLRKAMLGRPSDGQTGPAVRGDRGVMDKHAGLLADDEARLYRELSEHIMDYYGVK